ncbi:MAG: C40 family peptidase [Acidobacteria bacterium]|nr:C40 family peptidase [Acidobacteriota bacterium]
MKFNSLVRIALSVLCLGVFASATVVAQDRPRVVKPVSSRPINQPPAQPQTQPVVTRSTSQRPALTSDINVVPAEPLVKKTGESSPVKAMNKAAARRTVYGGSASSLILQGINSRLGIPYRYGSQGPYTYDCSGFVWAVFRDSGIEFERTSARSLWAMSTPVTGDERYVFGTLVFLNKLGHIGIVADENGFYHASRSKGITYSPFKGYWEKRIDGFRRLDLPVADTLAK